MTDTHEGRAPEARSTTGDARQRNMIGRSAAFAEVERQIQRIAGTCAPVLIEGETGCGKELAARAIHYLSLRCNRPFVPVNCGAVAENLIESELFGHARGAFTDARTARTGLVAQAHLGTLFLDEIDALSTRAQVAMLRFLQDQRYRPVGQSTELACDTRILAASNRPLEPLAERGEFRKDLLYRLNVVVLRIPPLRERREDIELLARHFFERYCRQYGFEDRRLHRDTLAWMEAQPWPGNIRELENTVHRLVLMGESGEPRETGPRGAAQAQAKGDFHSAKRRAVETFERTYLVKVLEETHGNVSEAARLAHKERRALGRLIKKHGIDTAGYRG